VDRAAGKDFIRVFLVEIGSRADEIADVGRLKPREAASHPLGGIRRANEDAQRAQLIGHDSEKGGGICVKAFLAARAKLQRATGVGADVEGKVVVVVESPGPESQADHL